MNKISGRSVNWPVRSNAEKLNWFIPNHVPRRQLSDSHQSIFCYLLADQMNSSFRSTRERATNEIVEDQMEDRSSGNPALAGILESTTDHDRTSQAPSEATNRLARDCQLKATNQHRFGRLHRLSINRRLVPLAVKHSGQGP